ncbi:MAG: hypothetical protein SGPRY_001857 [Prymnesium sp.]
MPTRALAKALPELPLEKVLHCWYPLAKPIQDEGLENLHAKAKERLNVLFPNRSDEDQVEVEPEPTPELRGVDDFSNGHDYELARAHAQLVQRLNTMIPQLRMGDLGCASVRGAGGGARSCSSSAESKPHSAKIDALVEQIAALSLLEASELTEALKVRRVPQPEHTLHIAIQLSHPYAAQTKLGISSAMMMPSGGGGGGGGGGAAAPAAEEAEAVVEKTHFTVKLEAFDAASKIKLIKEVSVVRLDVARAHAIRSDTIGLSDEQSMR